MRFLKRSLKPIKGHWVPKGFHQLMMGCSFGSSLATLIIQLQSHLQQAYGNCRPPYFVCEYGRNTDMHTACMAWLPTVLSYLCYFPEA